MEYVIEQLDGPSGFTFQICLVIGLMKISVIVLPMSKAQ